MVLRLKPMTLRRIVGTHTRVESCPVVCQLLLHQPVRVSGTIGTTEIAEVDKDDTRGGT